MDTTRRIVVALILMLMALAAWIAVVVWARTIVEADATRVALASETIDSSGQYITAVRKHTLALDAASSSAAIKESLNVDLVTLSQAVSSAGSTAHVALAVSGVTPVSVPLPAGATPLLYEYDINVLGTGSFAAIMQAEQVLEHLPFPARVQAFDIETSPGNSSLNMLPQWSFTARIRVVTTTQPTS